MKKLGRAGDGSSFLLKADNRASTLLVLFAFGITSRSANQSE